MGTRGLGLGFGVVALCAAMTGPAVAQETAEQKAAAAVAKRLADTEARAKVKTFQAALKGAKEERDIVEAVRAVSATHHLFVVKALAPLVQNPLQGVVDETARCLGEIGQALPDKERGVVVAVLAPCLRLEEKRPDVAIAAIKAMAIVGDRGALRHLYRVMDSKTAAVAAEALRVLGVLKSEQSVEPLIDTLKKYEYSPAGSGNDTSPGWGGANPGPETMARMAAIATPCLAALQALTGEKFTTAAEWKNWWKTAKATFHPAPPKSETDATAGQ